MRPEVDLLVAHRLEHAGHHLGLHASSAPANDPIVSVGMSGLFKGRTYWRKHDIRPSYDVVIIGGGAHGLATAY